MQTAQEETKRKAAIGTRWAISADRLDLAFKFSVFFIWLAAIVLMVDRHAYWRDEVRALSISLNGDTVFEMLRNLHGEGHPALWNVILRFANDVVPSHLVLGFASVSVAAVAALLLVFASPFRNWIIVLILLSYPFLFEYSVMARNYGISVLLMFALAYSYPRYRENPLVIGIILFLLANTNAHSVILVGAFVLFWFVDLLQDHGLRRLGAFKPLLSNLAICVVGIAVCILTIYPTYNDAAQRKILFAWDKLANVVFLPGAGFGSIFSQMGLVRSPILASAILFGCTLGLVRRPSAFLGALSALIGFSLLFYFVYPGAYRHIGLWLGFVVAMYWIAFEPKRNSAPSTASGGSAVLLTSFLGLGFALGLLIFQARLGIDMARAELMNPNLPPNSRSRAFGSYVSLTPALKDAIIIADPDFMLESLPYYIDNRTYLLREERFGKFVKFTNTATLSITLDDILAAARRLSSEYRKPIVILLTARLDVTKPAQTLREGYNWKLILTPQQVQNFLSSVRLLARFAPARMGESYDVYLLDYPAP